MARKPLILAIDDDQFYLDEIKMELEDHAACKVFRGPNEFEEDVTKDDIKNADLVIVDYDYGYGTAVRSQVAEYIRDYLNFRGKIVLCSLHECFNEDEEKIRQNYDVVIHKRDLSWEKMSQFLAK